MFALHSMFITLRHVHFNQIILTEQYFPISHEPEKHFAEVLLYFLKFYEYLIYTSTLFSLSQLNRTLLHINFIDLFIFIFGCIGSLLLSMGFL